MHQDCPAWRWLIGDCTYLAGPSSLSSMLRDRNRREWLLQEDDGGRTVKVEVSLLVLRLPPGVPPPVVPSPAVAARNNLAAVEPGSASTGNSLLLACDRPSIMHLPPKKSMPAFTLAIAGRSNHWFCLSAMHLCRSTGRQPADHRCRGLKSCGLALQQLFKLLMTKGFASVRS